MSWEYTVLVFQKNQVQELNNMGKEGWELVQIEDDHDGWTAYFKRPKENKV